MRQTALACSNLFVISSICMYIYERARAHTHAHTRTHTLVYTYTHSHVQYLYLCVAYKAPGACFRNRQGNRGGSRLTSGRGCGGAYSVEIVTVKQFDYNLPDPPAIFLKACVRTQSLFCFGDIAAHSERPAKNVMRRLRLVGSFKL